MQSKTIEKVEEDNLIRCDQCGGEVNFDEIIYDETKKKGVCEWCYKEPDFSLIEQVFISWKDVYNNLNEK